MLVSLPLRAVDRPFTYSLPASLASRVVPGSTVLVPFGRRTLAGYVIGPGQPSHAPGGALRPVEEVLESRPLWTPELLGLTRWMSRYYAALWLECLRCVVPAPVRRMSAGEDLPLDGQIRLSESIAQTGVLPARLKASAPLQARALELLLAGPGQLPVAQLLLDEGVRPNTLRGMIRKGLVEVVARPPGPAAGEGAAPPVATGPDYALSSAQERALQAVDQALQAERSQVFLLHGVTGSGKTEVYLQAIARCRARGRSALVLVPEISLTPQAIERYQQRLSEPVAVLHSHLSAAERHARWWQVRLGQAKVVLGARSAVFAPLDDLGLIVIDEEHEASYKQESSPRYHARQVAVRRARDHHCPVILGSATPGAESFHWASEGHYHYLSLPQRVTGQPLPVVRVVDLLESSEDAAAAPGEPPPEHRPGFREGSLLGPLLQERMEAVLGRGDQVLLFLNRRGFAPYLLCADCRHVPRCPNCDISLTYHRSSKGLVCHYCAYRQAAPTTCPECGGLSLRFMGAGTQRVEDEVEARFPAIRMARMDRDTTVERGSHARILGAFARGEVQVLVGTQMIAKGLDYPGVGLVGILMADTGLFVPDFRASERTFQVLLQAAGRAGRGASRGEVIIQTCLPDHPAVALGAAQDYSTFMALELKARQELHYPPFAHLVNIILSGENGELVAGQAEKLGKGLRECKSVSDQAEILGPAPCPLSRLRGRHRWHLTLRGKAVQDIVPRMRTYLASITLPHGVFLAVDVDPVSLL